MRVRSEKRRLALIKKTAKKYGIWKSKPKAKKIKPLNYDSSIDSHNINAYTDAAKYANDYYGDRMREQKTYDADWN